MLQLLKPICLESVLSNKTSHHSKKPAHPSRVTPTSATRESSWKTTKTQHSKKKKKLKKKKVSCSSCKFSGPQRGTSRGGAPSFPSDLSSLEHSIHSWSSKDKTGCANDSWAPSHNYIFLVLVDQFSIPDRFPQHSHWCDEREEAKITAERPIALILTVYDVLPFQR